MDSPRKNNDCYFYYYSTCLKGEGCMFRHEPAALGCETVCTFWQQGKCLNQRCNFRHMELRKNRKIIPCYWENQPGGCRKPHCSFQHKNPREPVGQELEKNKECENVGASKSQERADWSRRTVLPEGAQFEECVGSSDDTGRVGPRHVSQGSETSYGSPPVDPLVVNFEEESDNESVPTSTPTKKPQKNVHVKTLEEIRLERIQAESAAFYSYKENPAGGVSDLRSRIVSRKPYSKPNQDFRVLTLEEIRKRKVAESSGIDNGGNDFQGTDIEHSASCIVKSNDLSVVNSLRSDTIEHVNNNTSVKSLTNIVVKTNISLKRNDEIPRKRAHSPIIFDIVPKKSCVIRDDDMGDNSVVNKENNICDIKMMDKDVPSTLKKFRKSLKRGSVNETSGRVQSSRIIRLRRRNIVDSHNMEVTENFAKENNQVSSVVPDNASFVSKDCNTENDAGDFEPLDALKRTCTEWEKEGINIHTLCSESNGGTVKHTNEVIQHEKRNSMESLSIPMLQDSGNCDSMMKEKWSSSNQDDELFMSNSDYPVVLKADDDILQDIDELLRE